MTITPEFFGNSFSNSCHRNLREPTGYPMAVQSRQATNIQLIRNPAFFGINGDKKDKKPMPYLDVSDDEVDKSKSKKLKRKKFLFNDSIQVGSHAIEHKKRRYLGRDGNFCPPNDSNGAGPSQLMTGVINGTINAKVKSIQEQRISLPISTGQLLFFGFRGIFTLDPGRETLVEEIRKNDVTILLGETGSGKTTRRYSFLVFLAILTFIEVPQYILESGLARNGIIAVTQPRRVAATSLAHRVAAEQNTSVGGLVGYAVRFEEKHSANTRIKYMTDGMIVREFMSDPTLSKYSVVIVDEAHERTLRTDLLIANLKSIQKQRNPPHDLKGKGSADGFNPLRIIIMSATLDAEKFSNFFHKYDTFRFLLYCLMISKCKNPLRARSSASGENISHHSKPARLHRRSPEDFLSNSHRPTAWRRSRLSSWTRRYRKPPKFYSCLRETTPC